MATHKYSFHEERGDFHGYVEDEMGNVIFEMHYPEYYEDDETGELIESSSLFEDGYMKGTDDTEGLKEYLVSINKMEEDDELLSEDEYEKSYMSGGQTGAYGHGTTLLADGGDITEEEREEEDEEENDEEKHLEELSEETDIPTDVISEYASDRGIDYMDLTARGIEDNYIGRFTSREAFGEHLVDNLIITDLSNYLEMYDSDKEMFADEEAESRLDGMDEDDLVREANLEDEYEEVKERLERIDELNDEIKEIESKMEELREQETETEEEAEEVSQELGELDSELEERKTELDNIENEDNDLESIIDRAREDARENIAQEILDELNRDAVGYFTDNLGYDVSDLANHSLFTVDYDAIADDESYSHTYIDGDDGNVYVFTNYKWGGKLEQGGSVEQGNFRMLLNQAKELKHHAEELEHVLSKRPRVDAWVVALSERASLALSDITHYLDGTLHDDNASDSDVLNINVPTYIRTLEYAREDAKSDVDLHKLTENALEVSDKEGVVQMDDYEDIVPKMEKGGQNKWEVDPTYTHFAVRKSNGKIVNGWDYKDTDKEDIKYYSKYDLVDMGNPSDFKILTASHLKRIGVDPFDSDNWGNEYKHGGVNLGASFEKMKGQMKGDEVNNAVEWFMGKDVRTRNKLSDKYFPDMEGLDIENEDIYEIYLKEHSKKYAKGGSIESDLKSFNVDNLDAFEKMQYDNFIKNGRSKEIALSVLINNVEGDYSQLSPKLRAIARKHKMALGGFLAGAVAGGVGTYLYQKNKEKPNRVERNKGDWKDDLKSDIDKDGFEYAMTQLVDEDDIKDDKFSQLRKKYLSALKKITNLNGLNKEDKEELQYYYDNEGIDYSLVDKGMWRGIKNTKFQSNRKEYIKSRDAIKKYIGLDTQYAKGGETTFQEKVTKVAKKNVGKAVPKSVQKDYGKRFSKAEALDSARRIVGSMKAKGYFK